MTLVMTFCFLLPLFTSVSTVQAKCTQPDCAYYQAENDYNALLKNPKLKSRRDKWLECIDGFKKVYTMDPEGVWAPAGLYMTGLLYKHLHKYSGKNQDLEQAVTHFEKAKAFSKSQYSLEAVKQLRKLPEIKTKTVEIKPSRKAHTPPKNAPKVSDVNSSGDRATIKKIRFGTLPTRTRIVIDTDQAVYYKYGLLRKDPAHNKSQRLYVDLRDSSLSRSVKREISIDDERVEGVRTAPQSSSLVRVAVDIKTFKDYKIFSLRNPSRVVIDVWGQSSVPELDDDSGDDETDGPSITAIINSGMNSDDLAKQLHLGVKRVVIDPGHGGQDRGAPGYFKGVYEKDIVLSLSKKLAERLRKKLDLEVIMTRDDDTFITLEERTRIANRKKADLFISIHTNASRDRRAYGIETYFLNLAKDKASVSVAARENATSEKNISDLQTILDSLMRNTKITESSRLATYVQDDLYRTMKKHYSHTKNKGVKQAPFYVLLGARMPAILVETSFISNKRECQRLQSKAYQDRLCDAIVDGIETYIKKTSP